MSADDSNIPVSLEFFKKCTYHEEIVMQILKSKSRGNAEKLKSFLKSETIKQNALYNYYRAYYLQPEIRSMHPIRLKPMPETKRKKLLQLPNTHSAKSNIESGKDFVSAGNEQNVGPVSHIKKMNAAKLTKQSVGEELMVEDDAMPDEDSNESHNLKCNSTNQKQLKEKEIIALEKDDVNVISAQKSRKRTGALSVEGQPPAKLLKYNVPPVTTETEINDSVLKKFAHCCPVTLKEFKKYTNVKEIVLRSTEKNIGITKERMPYLCKKIHLMYYLYPQFRHSNSILERIKLTTNCPNNVKERFYQIPLIQDPNENEQINGEHPEEILGNPEGPNDACNNAFINSGNNLVDAEDGNREKTGIEILENRLLAPPKNSSCKFCQVSLEDFKALTNVLEHVQADDDQALQDMYIRFMQFDEEVENKLTAMVCLFFTLNKCPHVCTDCEQKWMSQSISNVQSGEAHQKTSLERQIEQVQKSPKTVGIVTKTSGDSEIVCIPNSLSQSISNVQSGEAHQKTSLERQIEQVQKSPKTVGIVTKTSGDSEIVCIPNSLSKQVSKDNERPEQTKDSSLVKLIQEKCASSKEINNSYNTPCPNVTNATIEIHKDNNRNHHYLHMILSNNEWFNEFRCSLLKTLQEPFDYSQFPVTIKTFKKCSMYLEPLHQILCDFCGSEVNLVDRLFGNKELCDNLLLYYYRKYFTFSNLRNKYPLKLKKCPASLRKKMLAFVNANEGDRTTQDSSDIPNSNKNAKEERSVTSETTKSDSLEKVQEGNINWLEKAKELFSSPVDRTHTLAYILRTSFDLKQRITHTLSNLSLEEFKSLTHIYEGSQSYQDDTFLVHIFDYICNTSIWPQSVFIKLEEVLLKLAQSELLLDQNINSCLLAYISPKFLHWSNLMTTTNFIVCVCEDYLHRTGETLEITNKMLLEETSQYYYSCCWSHERWIGQIPIINKELVFNLTNDIETAIHSITLQPQTVEENETVGMAASNAECIHLENICHQVIAIEHLKDTLPTDKEQVVANTSCENDISPNEPKRSTSIHDVFPAPEVSPTPLHNNTVLLETEIIRPENISPFTLDNLDFATSRNLQEKNACTQWDASLNNNNYITMPNTQAQIGALLDETGVQNNFDPLENKKTELFESCNNNNMDKMHPTDEVDVAFQANQDNQSPILCLDSDDESRCSIDKMHPTDEVDVAFQANQDNQSPILCLDSDDESRSSIDKVITCDDKVAIKTKYGQLDPLRCLKFVEKSDGKFECMSFEEEIVNLVNSNVSQLNNEAENLPSSQIMFVEDEINSTPQNTPNKFIGYLISSGNSGSTFQLAQRVPTYCHLSEIHHDSSGSTQSNLPCFPTQSAIEMTQETSKGMDNGVPVDENVEIATAPILSGIDAVPPILHIHSELPPTTLAVQSTKKTQKKVTKSAKVTDPAPLLTHPFRSLPLCVRNNKNTQQRRSPRRTSSTEAELPATAVQNKSPARVKSINNTGNNHMSPRRTSLRFSQEISPNFPLAATSTQIRSTLQPDGSSQHISILQAEPLRISQELLKDCTVFNNTSLCRAADQITCNTGSTSEGKCDGKYSEVPNTDSCPKITASKSPIKTLKVIKPTSNVVGNYKLSPLRKKFLLCYKLLDFHYFDKLNPIHVNNYQFTTTNYGSRHLQATIFCGDLKTKLTNSALASLGFTYERKPDFFTLLQDLGEFHYAINQRLPFYKECDLRKRVLFCYIHSTLPFCFAQLEYNKHNSEFSECKTIKHLGMSDVPLRTPYKCLTNAIEPQILEKIEKLKKDLRN